jgi:signal transduction histidine kinase
MRRSVRAWGIELVLVAVATLLGLFFLDGSISDDAGPGWRVNAAAGVAGLLLPIGLLNALPMGAVLVVLYAVALHRPARVAIVVAGSHATALASIYWAGIPDKREYWEVVPFLVSLDVAVVAVAMLIRSQRRLVRSWADRAREAEQGQRLRIEEARHAERERIAREMHDVLAHRISLLAVHAGALQVRRDASDEERQAASVIRQCAYEALEDLREVVGMLRGPTGAGEADRPQPTLADVPALVQESRQAGTLVHLDDDTAGAVSQSAGRHAYRIVQEALTNARKHAPGAPVRVRLSTPERGGLCVEVANPTLVPAGQQPAGTVLPGAGMGLVGLGERVQLAGGRLTHGPTPEGEFRLSAWLP